MTLSLLEKIEYESVFSFIFSPRKYTKASYLEDDVPRDVKKKRLYLLQQTQEKIQMANNKRLIGSEVEVLVTNKHPKKAGDVVGRTESYRVVNFKSNAEPGEFRTILVEAVGAHSLRGREVKI